MPKRTLLIGLDGATFRILDPLMREGVMPSLKEIVDSGVRADLTSVIPVLTPPAWTSLMTGRSPGHHGILDFFLKESPTSHYIRFANSHDVRTETIWSMAGRGGMKCTVLNFPSMFPPPGIEGFIVPGWVPWKQLRLGCHPGGLYDRLKAQEWFNPREMALDMDLGEKGIEGCSPEEYEEWIAMHIRRERQWFRVMQYLDAEEPCDLTAILFDGVDRLQHLCWRFLDEDSRPGLGTAWELRIRELCLDYYRELDRLLASSVRMVGKDATIVIASDHGFGPQKRTFFANTWLERNGHLTWADGKAPKASPTEVLGVRQLARHVYLLDWSRTRAYAPTPSGNGIHIVRRDAEHPGGVPDDEYESFRDDLIESLLREPDPETGRPVVSRVLKREDVFSGPAMDLAPDLTLELEDGGSVSILAAEEAVSPRPETSGTHRREGVFIARGPEIRRGASLNALSILDVAPLILYGLGLPIPAEMEGRVPEEALVAAVQEARDGRSPARTSPRGVKAQATTPMMDPEAEAEIMKRLRALGYVE